MSNVRARVPLLALLLVACGEAADPALEQERLRVEAERSAGLEAAEREILEAGLPLPAGADAEVSAGENEVVATNGTLEEAK